jgi:hypothetical protein
MMEKEFYIVENSGSTVLSPVVTAMMADFAFLQFNAG